MTALINCTPHDLVLRDADGTDHTIAASGIVPRVSSTPGALRDIGIIVPVADADTFGDVTGLPAPVDGTFLIVSGMVGAALAGTRPDVLVPGTGPADGCIRDGGRIIAVTRLKRV